MKNENMMYGIGGLVIGIILINVFMPVTWRGTMMTRNSVSGPECGPTGCSLGNGSMMGQDGITNIGMMGAGGAGMMNGAYGNGAMMMNATDIDKAFIEEMIPHHRIAVMMATMLKSRTNRPEMRKLADDIISAQNREIEMMKDWYTAWYYKGK